MQTLPWHALYDFAIEKGIIEVEVSGKDKNTIIQKILSNCTISDLEIEQIINDYIYGDRVTFTIWSFDKRLNEEDYAKIEEIEGEKIASFGLNLFRNLEMISVKKHEDRIELVYVYSREYLYVNEEGHNASVWEQHRGCLWIGLHNTYLACISKHDKMTMCITQIIAQRISNGLKQLKPPKKAIERCIDPVAISRIVLQGVAGEKTIVSKAGGITEEQGHEIERIKENRFDTSGSYIANVAENAEATIKYNLTKGSIGIHKHISSKVLFEWSKNAIEIILEEIENLKGQPAVDIFRELGREIKWTGLSTRDMSHMNWFLTQIIAALDCDEEYSVQIPEECLEILNNKDLFLILPRIYCNVCDLYEIPCCANCGKELTISHEGELKCVCGAPLKIKCSEGHDDYKFAPWFVPKKKFISMIERNINKIYPDEKLNYHLCIMGDMLSIVFGDCKEGEVEILFDDITCFQSFQNEYIPSSAVLQYAIRLKEKCGGICSRSKVNQCIYDKTMICLPKIFYSILPSYRPQPHKGNEYGDISGQIQVGQHYYEMKGIVKKNSKNTAKNTDIELLDTYLLSTSKEGQEIIRQFVEQGMNDNRCKVIAVVAPQYFDADLKGTLRNLARLANKKIVFIELDEVCKLIEMNDFIDVL